uniref:Na(+)/H(+) exchange regulatory cofactor NHE-RF2-like n=1 Tax=Fundulus heteroclitus TaxID=8078 RepID=A0A3Q2QV17_FUNHE
NTAPQPPRKPRLCIMAKGDNGYGFHLHGEKGKSGQFIRKVESGSPAEASGMLAGDRVVAVNGVNVERETHHQVVQRIKAVENETRLLVVDQETYESLRSLHLTPTEEMAVLGTEALPAVPSPPASPPSSPPQVDPSELAPRLCHLTRSAGGYGFNLHSERSRPGQYIRSLDPGSPAERAGLRPQDRLVEVGGRNYDGPSISNGSPGPQVNGTPKPLPACVFPFSRDTKLADDDGSQLMDPFAEIGLRLSATAAEEKMKIHAKEKKKAPQMDWMKKYELFSNF